MLIEHQGKSPQIDVTAQVAPTAVLSGEAHLGPGHCVGFGVARLPDGGLDMVEITRRYTAFLQRHGDDRIL